MQDLVGAADRQPCGSGDDQQVIAAVAAGMKSRGVENGADPARGIVKRPVGAAVDRGGARGGVGEAEEDPQRRGLARAVRTQEAQD
jgi:hypothetical protein